MDKLRNLKGLKEVKEFIEEKNDFIVLNDYDADGLSAGAIIRKALERLDKEYEGHTLQHFSKEELKEYSKHYKSKPFILIDFGSGYLDMIKKEIKNGEYCIIDHHEVEGETEEPHLNPHLSGRDGSSEISSSGLSYAVAREIDDENKDMSKIGMIGALGDMQYNNEESKLIGLNREILKEGEEAGEIETRKDITLYGRHSRDIVSFLTYSNYPYLPGLTGDRRNCYIFLKDLGIDLKNGKGKSRKYCELSQEEKRRLISGLHVYGRRNGVPERVLRNLVGEVYELKKEPMKSPLKDGKEFGTILNACGRHERPELGIKISMGDRNNALEEAMRMLRRHRRKLSKGIKYVKDKGVGENGSMYLVDTEGNVEPSIIGIVMGMLYSTSEVKRDKPIIGLADEEEGEVKVSGRGTEELVEKGLNLGEAFYKAAEKTQGEGGGHDIAAGATIPKENTDKFIEISNQMILEQLEK